MPRILIAGDINPDRTNEDAFRRGDAETILGDLMPVFEGVDLAIANLEAPLIGEPTPINKSGPVLGVPDSCVAGLRESGFDVLGLSNNHTMDHGDAGLTHTLAVCEAEGIACVGAGENLDAASKIFVRNVNGHRLGILALAEHEFGVASRTSSGVCPLDPVVFGRAIAAQKGTYDSLVVMVHGGNEFYQYPRPSLQQICRYLIELGASLVVCQHSHIVGSYEQYRGSHIIYGQGNFISAGNNRPEFWHEGLLVIIDVETGRAAQLETIAIVQSEGGTSGAKRMQGERLAEFERNFEKRNTEIMDPCCVEDRWDEFCERQEREYLRRYGALHRIFRLLDRFTGYIRYLLGRRNMRLEHLNLVRCESHREVLVNLLSRD